MKTVSISQLRAHLSEVLRQVQGGTAVAITKRGKEVARMVPAQRRVSDVSEIWVMLADIDRLAADISAHWPTGVSILDAVDDARGAH